MDMYDDVLAFSINLLFALKTRYRIPINLGKFDKKHLPSCNMDRLNRKN